MSIRKILKLLYIIVSNEERPEQGLELSGMDYSNTYRLNPYNPLTYITIIFVLIIGILMFSIDFGKK